jgi:hypothetical protein
MTPLAMTVLVGIISHAEMVIDAHVGGGPVLQRGDRYTVTYKLEILGGKELANSTLRGLPFSKELGDGRDGYLDKWVKGMSVGGMRRVFFGADQVPGLLRMPLPSRTNLMVTLTLVGLKKKLTLR